jgi:hypothetical protein
MAVEIDVCKSFVIIYLKTAVKPIYLLDRAPRIGSEPEGQSCQPNAPAGL